MIQTKGLYEATRGCTACALRDGCKGPVPAKPVGREDTEAHSSLKKFYTSPMSPVLLTRPSLVRRVAKELPDIGWERSLTIEQRWSTVREMVNAPADEWIELEGIGKGIASKIDQELG